jgi:hypothetical protein
MKILFLHGWQSVPGGVKPTYLAQHAHEVINPKLPDEDFAEAVRIAQAEFDKHSPDVVVGSSRGGAVAMSISSGDTPLVLLCPAWKRWGTARSVKPNTIILHSLADDVVPFVDSEELVKNSEAALIEVGNDHRLADPEPLAAMLEACEASVERSGVLNIDHNGPQKPPMEVEIRYIRQTSEPAHGKQKAQDRLDEGQNTSNRLSSIFVPTGWCEGC